MSHGVDRGVVVRGSVEEDGDEPGCTGAPELTVAYSVIAHVLRDGVRDAPSDVVVLAQCDEVVMAGARVAEAAGRVEDDHLAAPRALGEGGVEEIGADRGSDDVAAPPCDVRRHQRSGLPGSGRSHHEKRLPALQCDEPALMPADHDAIGRPRVGQQVFQLHGRPPICGRLH